MKLRNFLSHFLPRPAASSIRAEERIISKFSELTKLHETVLTEISSLRNEILELKSTNNVSSPMATEQKSGRLQKYCKARTAGHWELICSFQKYFKANGSAVYA